MILFLLSPPLTVKVSRLQSMRKNTNSLIMEGYLATLRHPSEFGVVFSMGDWFIKLINGAKTGRGYHAWCERDKNFKETEGWLPEIIKNIRWEKENFWMNTREENSNYDIKISSLTMEDGENSMNGPFWSLHERQNQLQFGKLAISIFPLLLYLSCDIDSKVFQLFQVDY